MIARQVVAGFSGERAGAVNFAGHMCGDREAVANSGRPCGSKNLEIRRVSGIISGSFDQAKPTLVRWLAR
jgi:hypothetical protein